MSDDSDSRDDVDARNDSDPGERQAAPGTTPDDSAANGSGADGSAADGSAADRDEQAASVSDAADAPSRARHAHAEQTDTPPFGLPRLSTDGESEDTDAPADEVASQQPVEQAEAARPSERPEEPEQSQYGPPQQYQTPQYEGAQNQPQEWAPPAYGEQQPYQGPQYDRSRYDQPQYEAPRYDAPQYDQPRYDQPQYGAPQYDAPQYGAPQYPPPQGGSQNYAPPFQPLAPSTPPPMRQGPSQPPEQPSAPRHYAPEQQPGGPQAPYQPPPPQEPPQQPVPPPRPEDLLEPNQSPVTTDPAHQGWRGRINRGTFGLVKPKAGPEEIRLRTAITGIQRSFSRPMTVVVVQPKGGAGKTPTTICLSAAFGAYRGGYVVGWDDNETRGTLAVRVANPDDKRTTVWDLLSDLAAFERFDARVGDLSYYVRAQPDAHFDALVSDDNPANMAQIGEDEFHRLHRVLQRFYRLIVVDTGNNVRSPNWQAAVNAADLVVVVSTYQRDAGYSGSWVLDHLAATGREELARNAVTVLTAADPTTDKGVRQQLIDHFSARTRAVTEIPYDPQLAHGGSIRWTELAERTRQAWIHAGATIVDALVEQDQEALAARRS